MHEEVKELSELCVCARAPGSTLQLSDVNTLKMHLLLWQVFHFRELVIIFFFDLKTD
jgi:hypothetical protein